MAGRKIGARNTRDQLLRIARGHVTDDNQIPADTVLVRSARGGMLLDAGNLAEGQLISG